MACEENKAFIFKIKKQDNGNNKLTQNNTKDVEMVDKPPEEGSDFFFSRLVTFLTKEKTVNFSICDLLKS